MLEDGLSYPVRGDNAVGRIVIGGLLGILSFLVVPVIALFGYLIRVLEHSARGETDPPAFEEWGDLIVEGLKGIAVAVVYGIVPFFVFFFAVVFAGVGASAEGASGGLIAGLGVLGILVSFVVFFLLYYLIPAALTNMAIEGRFGAAFDLGTLKGPLLSFEYFVAWLLPFVIAFVVNIVSVVFVLLTFGLGALVLPFLQFYVQVSVFYMFGRAFGDVVGVDQAPAAPEDPPAGAD